MAWWHIVRSGKKDSAKGIRKKLFDSVEEAKPTPSASTSSSEAGEVGEVEKPKVASPSLKAKIREQMLSAVGAESPEWKEIVGKALGRALASDSPEEMMRGFIKALRDLTPKDEGGDSTPIGAYRNDLLQMILPNVVSLSGKGMDINDNLKDWAFALGEVIGMLAGIGVKQEAMHGAINEVFNVTHAYADYTAKALAMISRPETEAEAAEDAEKDEDDEKPEKRPVAKPAAEKADLLKHMIASLESQAKAEKDPAMSAALKAQAAKLKLELTGTKVEAA